MANLEYLSCLCHLKDIMPKLEFSDLRRTTTDLHKKLVYKIDTSFLEWV